NYGYARAPPVAVAVEQIVVAYRNVEQIAWRDARRVMIVVFRARRRYAHARGSRGCRTGAAARRVVAERRCERGKDPLSARTGTEQPNRPLLVSVEGQSRGKDW